MITICTFLSQIFLVLIKLFKQVCGLMKIKNYDTPTACKKNYYFSEKKKAIAFLLDCLNIRKLSQSKPQLSLHNHVAHYSGHNSDEIDLGTEMWIFK